MASSVGPMHTPSIGDNASSSKDATDDRPKERVFDWERDTWKVIEPYLRSDDHLIAHHLDSYEHFVHRNVPAIIAQYNPIRLHFKYDPILGEHTRRIEIRLTNAGFTPPSVTSSAGCEIPITPHYARTRKTTYASNLLVDVSITTTEVVPRPPPDDPELVPLPPRVDTQEHVVYRHRIGSVPVMINSSLCAVRTATQGGASRRDLNECCVDPGGYFVVNGGEKVVITVERPAENRAMVYSRASPPSVDVKSIPSGKSVRPRPFQMKVVRGTLGEDVVRVFIPQVRQNIPLWTVLRALGARNDRQIHREMLVGLPSGPVYIYADQVLRSSMMDSPVTSEEEAIEFISRHVSSFGGGGGTEKSVNLAGALQHAHSRTRNATDDADVERAAQELPSSGASGSSTPRRFFGGRYCRTWATRVSRSACTSGPCFVG